MSIEFKCRPCACSGGALCVWGVSGEGTESESEGSVKQNQVFWFNRFTCPATGATQVNGGILIALIC